MTAARLSRALRGARIKSLMRISSTWFFLKKKVRLSFYGRSAFRQVAGPTALRATHSPTTSQADDMSIGQLFGCANHHEQERHAELNSMMCSAAEKRKAVCEA